MRQDKRRHAHAKWRHFPHCAYYYTKITQTRPHGLTNIYLISPPISANRSLAVHKVQGTYAGLCQDSSTCDGCRRTIARRPRRPRPVGHAENAEKVGTAVPCGPCDYSWTCRKCRTCRIPPLLMARATVPCRPHGMDPLNGPQVTAVLPKQGTGRGSRILSASRARSSRTGWPFRRNGVGVPAQRHHRSGATASPFQGI